MKINIIEICAGSIQSCMAAQEGGAARVELCDNLYEGGTTPSYATVKKTIEILGIGVNVMIRPRGSDFCYDELEYELMQEDIKLCKQLGAYGVVFGILLPDGRVDVERMKRLVALARPMSVTCHRAFDVTPDPYTAIEDVIKCGVDRLLTAGQKNTAYEGMALIRELVKQASDRIIIMPGSGVDHTNLIELRDRTGAREFHLTAQERRPSCMTYRKEGIYMGGLSQIPEFEVNRASVDKVKRVVALVNQTS